jgi:Ser/Thr protein kinase RdoA (MazF antagonist)
VPLPVGWCGATVLRCGRRWAELEAYVPHQRLAPTLDSYAWLFAALGHLHRELTTLERTVPRPLVATYAPPGTLRRWLKVTEAAVAGDHAATDGARHLRDLVGRLRRHWLPASRLPQQLVHGDVRLSNVGRTPDGTTLYLDFGFLAVRPRIHDVAYALAFMLHALDAHHEPESFAWQSVPPLIDAYEAAAHARLTAAERRALAPATAAVPLYHAALAGFAGDPVGQLESALPFLHLSDWLLAHPAPPWAERQRTDA